MGGGELKVVCMLILLAPFFFGKKESHLYIDMYKEKVVRDQLRMG